MFSEDKSFSVPYEKFKTILLLPITIPEEELRSKINLKLKKTKIFSLSCIAGLGFATKNSITSYNTRLRARTLESIFSLDNFSILT